MTVLAGQRITAGMFTQTKSEKRDTNSTWTATSYTETFSGDAACSFTFVAPASGEVLVHMSGFVDNSTTARTYVSWIIRNGSSIGSGTTFLDGGDQHSITNLDTYDDTCTRVSHVTGLTPGNTYNIRQQGKVSSASTGSSQYKSLIVQPLF